MPSLSNFFQNANGDGRITFDEGLGNEASGITEDDNIVPEKSSLSDAITEDTFTGENENEYQYYDTESEGIGEPAMDFAGKKETDGYEEGYEPGKIFQNFGMTDACEIL